MSGKSVEKSEGRSVTLLDVARKAGVSRATASLVVRNSPLVADRTRSHVLRTMKEIGYVYNRAAAGLRTSATGLIALVIPDIRNPYFAELTLGVQEALDERGESVFLANTSDSHDRQERILKRVLELRVDGVILCPARSTTKTDVAALEASGVPLVTVARRIRGAGCSYVGPDNVGCGAIAAEHLMQLGHTRIAFAGGESGSSARAERLRGINKALGKANLNLIAQPEFPPTRYDATDAVQRLFSDYRPTGIIAYNDVVAFGVIDGLLRMGINPGIGCSVVGMDDTQGAARGRPTLTTVAVQPTEVAEMAVKQLARSEDEASSPRKRLLQGVLIERETSARPPGV